MDLGSLSSGCTPQTFDCFLYFFDLAHGVLGNMQLSNNTAARSGKRPFVDREAAFCHVTSECQEQGWLVKMRA